MATYLKHALYDHTGWVQLHVAHEETLNVLVLTQCPRRADRASQFATLIAPRQIRSGHDRLNQLRESHDRQEFTTWPARQSLVSA